jgi:hypothetical protein
LRELRDRLGPADVLINNAAETSRHGVAVLSVDPELLPIGLPEPALGSTPDPRHQKGR